MEGAHHFLVDAEKFPQILRQYFDAGQISFMKPHPELLEAFGEKEIFRFFHHGELVLCNGFYIGETGSHAGKGRFAPGGKTRFFRQGTDVCLVEAGMTKRAPDAKFRKGLEPRPVLGGIIEVRAVDNIGKAFLFRDFLKGAEKEMFAEIRIFCKSFNAELVHFHHFLPDAFSAAVCNGVCHFPFRYRSQVHGDCHGPVPQHLPGLMHKVGGVHAAGKGQHHAAQLFQICFQMILFLL